VATHRAPVPGIQDYGVIGDCRAAALISKWGSIEWLCWPRFDSPSIFAAILDRERGGHWAITPTQPFRAERAYVENSNVLRTRFLCGDGEAVLTDLMPVASEEFKRRTILPDHELIRELRCIRGEIPVEMTFCPRASYGRQAVHLRDHGAIGVQFTVQRGAYLLRSNFPLRINSGAAAASVLLKPGDVLHSSLTYSEQAPAALPALGETITAAIERSNRWWQEWSTRCRYEGPYRETVMRSALALKLLSYAPSGALAAAATTSLPERLGDGLNWDYRFCWLRDASLSIRSMLGLGYDDEAESFLTWLLHATRRTQPRFCVLYDVFGEIAPREKELDELCGFSGSRPVRIGNGARQQVQLDVYGEVIDATAQFAQFERGFDRTTQRVLIGLGSYVAKNWDSPDEGIWESRCGKRNHTHSRLMCWTALDRLLALGEKGMLKGMPVDRFTRERDRIREQIEARAWNERLQSYVSVLDGENLDSTLLRLAWYGFEHADSHRMKATYRKVCERLGAGGGLLYRYERNPPEGAFGVCGFWAVEHLALGGGTLREAHELFRKLLVYRNDLGLFSEEIDPQSGRALGNFPQAFTHVGLISAALTLAEQERGTPHPAVQVGSDIKASPAGARA
jgi:GH15 family glucan-1,4-alpha-glucosidase